MIEIQEEQLRLARAIFGAGFSLSLLEGTLSHHLRKYKEKEPEMVSCLKNGLYVDALASGGRFVQYLWKLYLKVKTFSKKGGFTIHKWKTNDTELRNLIEKMKPKWKLRKEYQHMHKPCWEVQIRRMRTNLV